MLIIKRPVLSLKEKNQHNIGFPIFKLPSTNLKSFMTDPLNIIFDNFRV